MMWWGNGGYTGGGWIVMSLLMLVFWGAVAALVLWLMRAMRRPAVGTGAAAAPYARADEVLAERFARGDLSAEEFQARRELMHRGAMT